MSSQSDKDSDEDMDVIDELQEISPEVATIV